MTEQIDYDPNTVLEALNNKADRDLNNVTDGTYQVLTTKNITNCITKIPQDIKLELSTDGTLTLKAGSKLYDGAGNAINITSDISTKYTTTSNRKELIFFNQNKSLNPWYISDCYSGDSKPSATNYCWYDTNTKIVKSTTNAGSTYTENLSLPLAAVTSDSTGVTSIDQVFNGFGYIGSTIFALPGVEGLIPNGRNPDGSLNSIKFTTTSVLTATNNVKYYGDIALTAGLLEAAQGGNYNQDTNHNIAINGTIYNRCFCGKFEKGENGRITSFNPKTTLQILDRNDKEEIISWGMPDYDAGIDITAYSSSSKKFTAPCAGFINVVYLAQASDSACPHIGTKTFGSYNEGAIADNVTLLINEGETFYCTGMYTNKGTGSNVFYPMKGVV